MKCANCTHWDREQIFVHDASAVMASPWGECAYARPLAPWEDYGQRLMLVTGGELRTHETFMCILFQKREEKA